MFWSISETNVSTVTRLFRIFFFYKIHDSCHNFVIMNVCKAEHMFLSTGLVLFQCTACSRCASADFIAPFTMSQIGHVLEDFFCQTSIIYRSNLTNTL